jgi:hypothetical protein
LLVLLHPTCLLSLLLVHRSRSGSRKWVLVAQHLQDHCHRLPMPVALQLSRSPLTQSVLILLGSAATLRAPRGVRCRRAAGLRARQELACCDDRWWCHEILLRRSARVETVAIVDTCGLADAAGQCRDVARTSWRPLPPCRWAAAAAGACLLR